MGYGGQGERERGDAQDKEFRNEVTGSFTGFTVVTSKVGNSSSGPAVGKGGGNELQSGRK